MSALFLFVGVIAAGMAIVLLSIRKSPMGFEDEAGFHFDSFNDHALKYLQTAKLEERFLNGSCARSFHLRMAGMTKGFAVFTLVALLVVLPKTSNHLEMGESLGAMVNLSKATTSDSKWRASRPPRKIRGLVRGCACGLARSNDSGRRFSQPNFFVTNFDLQFPKRFTFARPAHTESV